MKLTNWTRFRLGIGASFAFARVAVAVVLTGLLVLGEQFVLYRHIETYNGLEVPVVVAVGSRQTTIPARSAEVLYAEDATQLHLRTTLTDGTVVEEFDVPAVNSQRMYVYNVARAAVLVTERIAYNRSGRTVPSSMIPSNQHNERWSTTVADVRFSAPPEHVTMGDREEYRELVRLVAASNTPAGRPVYLLHYVMDRQELALSHVRFDPLNSSMDGWIQAAPDRTSLVAILSARRPRSGSLLVYEYLLRTAQGAR